MYIRIIAGQFGKRKITAPDSGVTHPMSERVRNALFNIVGDEVDDASVLDAFAGSGSIGFEALSRGARDVTFVENDQKAVEALRHNVRLLKCENAVTIIKQKVHTYAASATKGSYDVIIADPPYDDMQLSTVDTLFDLLKVGGLMILSHPGRGEAPTKTGVVVVDNRSYGTAGLTFYRREDT